MWSMLAVADTARRCDFIADALEGGAREVSVSCALTESEARRTIAHAAPSLAAVSIGGPPSATLQRIALLRRLAPRMAIVAEVPADLPLVPHQAMAHGASDCLKRPAAPWEWHNRCRALLKAEHQRCLLVAALRRSSLRSCNADHQPNAFVDVLESADTLHDAVTGQHERRTGQLAGLVAEGLGLDPGTCSVIAKAAALHDIGKLGIRDAVLRKPGRYTAEERAVMSRHPRIGYEILRRGTAPVFGAAAEIALYHHERVDGTGYPQRLRGDAIPLPARITAVADVFDALAAGRPYHRGRGAVSALDAISAASGGHFDPDCVEALRSRCGEALAVVGG